MEQFIKTKLQKGEHILWTGTPANVKLLEAPYTFGIILRWVIAAVLVCFGVWYLGYAGTLGITGNQPVILMLVSFLVAAYLALDPIQQVARMKSRTLYVITNQRAIACYKARPMRMKFRTLDEVDEITVELLSTGCGNIYFGKKTKRAPKMARVQYAMAELQEHEENMPLVFYSVKNPEAVYESIPAQLGDIA